MKELSKKVERLENYQKLFVMKSKLLFLVLLLLGLCLHAASGKAIQVGSKSAEYEGRNYLRVEVADQYGDDNGDESIRDERWFRIVIGVVVVMALCCALCLCACCCLVF